MSHQRSPVTAPHSGDDLRVRNVARVLLLNQQRDTLLVRYEDKHPVDPTRPHLLSYWVTPGGGVHEHESFEQAALREVEEETSLEIRLGPCLWHRHIVLRMKGELVLQKERYFLGEYEGTRAEVTNQTAEPIRAHRWWSPEEIQRSTETFLPQGFAQLLEPIVRGELPSRPLVLGEPQP
jgi:8-oxo-dGTP pyrophosphatase MutT (NUDIX family)